MKCIVYNCENTSDHGRFIGDLCAPCHEFITKRKGRHSQAYRNELLRTIKTLEAFVKESKRIHETEMNQILKKLESYCE